MDTSRKPFIPEPILNYCFDLLPEHGQGSYFGPWRDLGQYWVWSGALAHHEEQFKVRERTKTGIVEQGNTQHSLMHWIGAGVTHQVAHLFGYWLESDADRVWIQISRPTQSIYTMIWGGGSGVHSKERILWVCPKCGEVVRDWHLSRPGPSIDMFMRQQLEAVRKFNGETTLRTCGACGFVHPTAYGFYPESDARGERVARNEW